MASLQEMTREEFLLSRLEEMQRDLASARQTDRAWTAVGNMHRQMMDVHAELTTLRAQREAEEAARDDAAMSDADVVAMLVQSIASLPDHMLGDIDAALAARLGRGAA